MKRLQDIASFFTTTHGALMSIIGIIAIGSSYLLRHDAANIKQYVDIVQIKADTRFTTIENKIVDLTNSVDDYTLKSTGNFITIKNEFSSHIQKSKDIKPDDRLNDILRVVNGISTEINDLKKNDR